MWLSGTGLATQIYYLVFQSGQYCPQGVLEWSRGAELALVTTGGHFLLVPLKKVVWHEGRRVPSVFLFFWKGGGRSNQLSCEPLPENIRNSKLLLRPFFVPPSWLGEGGFPRCLSLERVAFPAVIHCSWSTWGGFRWQCPWSHTTGRACWVLLVEEHKFWLWYFHVGRHCGAHTAY